MDDSLVRLTGVERTEMDLNTGRSQVWFARGEPSPTVAELLRAVRESGFTPTKVVLSEDERR